MKTSGELAKQVRLLGSPWSIQREINKAFQDDCSSINRFAEIIEGDVALCTRVLRLANSPLYGHAEEVGSIPEAIMLIGLQKTRDIVTVVLVLEIFGGISSEIVNMELFTRHSIGTALAARLLATLRRDSRAEQHFLAGLIHDVGRLAMYQQAPGQMSAVVARYWGEQKIIPLHQLEKESFGYDHAEVGAELLKFWRFPAAVCNAIRFHHIPNRAGEHEVEASLVHVADILSLSLAQGNSGELLPPAMDVQAWESLKLPDRTLELIIPELDRGFKELAEVFQCTRELATA